MGQSALKVYVVVVNNAPDNSVQLLHNMFKTPNLNTFQKKKPLALIMEFSGKMKYRQSRVSRCIVLTL